jgi:hypothetical protein
MLVAARHVGFPFAGLNGANGERPTSARAPSGTTTTGASRSSSAAPSGCTPAFYERFRGGFDAYLLCAEETLLAYCTCDPGPRAMACRHLWASLHAAPPGGAGGVRRAAGGAARAPALAVPGATPGGRLDRARAAPTSLRPAATPSGGDRAAGREPDRAARSRRDGIRDRGAGGDDLRQRDRSPRHGGRSRPPRGGLVPPRCRRRAPGAPRPHGPRPPLARGPGEAGGRARRGRRAGGRTRRAPSRGVAAVGADPGGQGRAAREQAARRRMDRRGRGDAVPSRHHRLAAAGGAARGVLARGRRALR